MIGCARCNHHWRHHREPGGRGACGVTTVTNADGHREVACDCPAWVVPSSNSAPESTGATHQEKEKAQ